MKPITNTPPMTAADAPAVAVDTPRTPPSSLALLRLAEVERRVLLKRTAIYTRIAEGKFPQPRKDGRRVTWYEADIDAYMATPHA